MADDLNALLQQITQASQPAEAPAQPGPFPTPAPVVTTAPAPPAEAPAPPAANPFEAVKGPAPTPPAAQPVTPVQASPTPPDEITITRDILTSVIQQAASLAVQQALSNRSPDLTTALGDPGSPAETIDQLAADAGAVAKVAVWTMPGGHHTFAYAFADGSLHLPKL